MLNFAVKFLFGIMLLIALLLVIRPQLVIVIQARFYRYWYKDRVNMDDDAIDSIHRSPLDFWLTGDRSEFIVVGPENPDAYTALKWLYRGFGIGMLVFLWNVYNEVILHLLD